MDEWATDDRARCDGWRNHARGRNEPGRGNHSGGSDDEGGRNDGGRSDTWLYPGVPVALRIAASLGPNTTCLGHQTHRKSQ
jgi:hypothetical protein